jgi:MFS family permease
MPSLATLVPPALQKPRFRLFAAGQVISVLGSWIQQVALGWLVWRLTGSVLLLGLTGFVLQIPHLFIAPVAGFVVDRLPRVKLLVAVNLALAAIATTLALLAFQPEPNVHLLLGVALLSGVANAFESPTRQALLGAIVEERALLPSAIGFNSVVFNSGRLVGPSVAGVLLLYVAEGWCFLINAASFFAVIAALLAMRLPEAATRAQGAGERIALRETVGRLLALPVVRYLLPSASAVALFSLPLTHLMPSIATAFFAGGQGTVGMCISALGLGALSIAGFLSMQRGYARQLRMVQLAPLFGGVALVAFSLSRSLPLSLALLVVIGAASLATSASTNTLLQQSVDDAWRGRVIGLYFTCFIGLAPIGNLLAGALASIVGLAPTLALNGTLVALAAVVARWRLAADPSAATRLSESLRR